MSPRTAAQVGGFTFLILAVIFGLVAMAASGDTLGWLALCYIVSAIVGVLFLIGSTFLQE